MRASHWPCRPAPCGNASDRPSSSTSARARVSARAHNHSHSTCSKQRAPNDMQQRIEAKIAQDAAETSAPPLYVHTVLASCLRGACSPSGFIRPSACPSRPVLLSLQPRGSFLSSVCRTRRCACVCPSVCLFGFCFAAPAGALQLRANWCTLRSRQAGNRSSRERACARWQQVQPGFRPRVRACVRACVRAGVDRQRNRRLNYLDLEVPPDWVCLRHRNHHLAAAAKQRHRACHRPTRVRCTTGTRGVCGVPGANRQPPAAPPPARWLQQRVAVVDPDGCLSAVSAPSASPGADVRSQSRRRGAGHWDGEQHRRAHHMCNQSVGAYRCSIAASRVARCPMQHGIPLRSGIPGDMVSHALPAMSSALMKGVVHCSCKQQQPIAGRAVAVLPRVGCTAPRG